MTIPIRRSPTGVSSAFGQTGLAELRCFLGYLASIGRIRRESACHLRRVRGDGRHDEDAHQLAKKIALSGLCKGLFDIHTAILAPAPNTSTICDTGRGDSSGPSVAELSGCGRRLPL